MTGGRSPFRGELALIVLLCGASMPACEVLFNSPKQDGESVVKEAEPTNEGAGVLLLGGLSSQIVFEAILSGDVSASLIPITNLNDETATISSIAFAPGSSSAFSLTSNGTCLNPDGLDLFDGCEIQITFTSSPGDHEGTLVVTYSTDSGGE